MHMFITPRKQLGVSIVTALFLIIVLALMGAGMVSLLSTSQQSVSQEITSTKTYMAGRSCLQWGMYQSVYASAAGSNTLTFNDQNSGLYKTRCTITVNSLTSDGLTFHNIDAQAEYETTSSPEYSQREMRLQFQP